MISLFFWWYLCSGLKMQYHLGNKVILHTMVCDITYSFLYLSNKSNYLTSMCLTYHLWYHTWYHMLLVMISHTTVCDIIMDIIDDITCLYLMISRSIVCDITLFPRWYCIFNQEHRHHQKNRDITSVITFDITYMWYCTWYCGDIP